MGKKREQKGEALLFRDNYASGFFLFFLFLPPLRRIELRELNKPPLGPMREKNPGDAERGRGRNRRTFQVAPLVPARPGRRLVLVESC